MTEPRVLVLEDDDELRDLVVRGLREEGLDARGAADAHAFAERFEAAGADLLVVDVGLPDADGRDVVQALRAHGERVPVIFLTARDALPDRLAGFAAGGDDYLTKPFALAELVARLEALLRRAGDAAVVEVGSLRLDAPRHAAFVDGVEIPLTPTEFRLLATLAARPGHAIRRQELVRTGWPHGAIVSDNTLDSYVARIRRKLRAAGTAPAIVTVHRVGYRLE